MVEDRPISTQEAPSDGCVGSCFDHVVQFYRTDGFLIEVVADYVSDSLSRGACALLIATEDHIAGVDQRLSSIGFDVAKARASKRLITLEASQTLASFMQDGAPNPDLFRQTVESVVREAVASGPKVNAFGEMVNILLTQGNGEGALALEKLWNELSKAYEFNLLCAYQLDAFKEPETIQTFEHVCQEHSRVRPTEDVMAEPRNEDELLRRLALLEQRSLVLENEADRRKEVERTLQEQSRTLQILQDVTGALVAEKDLSRVVQLATDAGRELSGADFGAFFYNVTDETGESYTLYTLSGAPREAFEKFPMPRNTAVFDPTFKGEGTIRISDVTEDPRYGKSAPYFGMPSGHLPVRSYLAVPVVSKAGEVLGGLFFGHSEAGVFAEGIDSVIESLAALSAVAIENADLQRSLERELHGLREAKVLSSRLGAIVEASDDAIISKNLDGIISTWNEGARRIFGYEGHEVIGKPVTILFPEGHINEESEIIGRIKKGERVDHYETKRQRKDGTILDISLTVSPVYGEGGKIVGASKIARDITQRKRDEAALAQAAAELARSRDELELRVQERTASLQEAIGQIEEFSYTVSHDLRAPLRAMSVRCNALREDYGNLLSAEPEAMEMVDRISENCVRLDKMIRDVLAYGRVARDQLTFVPISLDAMIEDTISHYPALQEPNARVSVVEPLGTVLGHEPSLVQILSNLLNNAVKFVAPNVQPQVRIWSEPKDGRVRLWIEDNGIGIDPSLQHRLFSMFERIHAELAYEGTGVGLAIVRKAAERMGGNVGVDSEVNKGSRFWVELPAAPAN